MQGRSPTCYSPVRHSCTPKGLTVRLACVKHAASVRPEPESNSPNKNNPSQGQVNSQSEIDQATKKNLGKNHAPTRGCQSMAKTNNKQKPPNTLLSSQTTHPASPAARLTRGDCRVLIVTDIGTNRRPDSFPGGAAALSGRTASQRLRKVTSGAHASQIP